MPRKRSESRRSPPKKPTNPPDLATRMAQHFFGRYGLSSSSLVELRQAGSKGINNQARLIVWRKKKKKDR